MRIGDKMRMQNGSMWTFMDVNLNENIGHAANSDLYFQSDNSDNEFIISLKDFHNALQSGAMEI